MPQNAFIQFTNLFDFPPHKNFFTFHLESNADVVYVKNEDTHQIR